MRRYCFMHKIILLIISIGICCAPYVSAYDDQETHPKITKKASENPNLNNYLINNLGFKKGLDEFLNYGNKSKTILKWLEKGSTDEDSPNCRASNHFHDPLKSWNQSYMTDQPLWLDYECSAWKPWYSNVTWATNYLSPSANGSKVSFSYSSSDLLYNWDRAINTEVIS